MSDRSALDNYAQRNYNSELSLASTSRQTHGRLLGADFDVVMTFVCEELGGTVRAITLSDIPL